MPRILTAAVAALASLATATAQDPEPRPRVEPAKFDWPLPSEVLVTQESLKKGKQAKIRFVLSLTQHESRVRVRMQDFEFLEVEGRDATTPEMQKALATAQTLSESTPDMFILPDGAFDGVGPMGDVVDRILALAAKRPGIDAKQIEQVSEMMKTPRFHAIMEAETSEYWNGWVGNWTGFDLAEGDEEAGEFEGTGGTYLLRHEGAAEEPGHIKIWYDRVVEGDAAKDSLIGMMRGLGVDAVDVEAARVGIGCSVTTDPRNLRPLHSVWTKTTMVKFDGKEHNGIERREYTFDWSRAEPEPKPK